MEQEGKWNEEAIKIAKEAIAESKIGLRAQKNQIRYLAELIKSFNSPEEFAKYFLPQEAAEINSTEADFPKMLKKIEEIDEQMTTYENSLYEIGVEDFLIYLMNSNEVTFVIQNKLNKTLMIIKNSGAC
jgi:chromosome segregation ATPase